MSAIDTNARADTAAPTILLIGGTGQVGRELLAPLSTLGRVVVTTRGGQVVSDFETVQADLTQPESLRGLVEHIRPRLIVNAAAFTAVDRAEHEVEQARKVNALSPQVLAESARHIGAALVHFSTDYVFNGSGTRPWKETDPCGPINVYGETKLAGERLIAATGCEHLIVRTSWVYAAHGNNFVRTMLRVGATKPELRVVADQIGAPTSARVIAQLTAEILRHAGGDFPSLLRRHGGVVHLACDGATSWHGFAIEIFNQAKALGYRLAVEEVAEITTPEYPTPARRPLNSRLDLSRLNEWFALRPPSWQTALRETLPPLIEELSRELRESAAR